MFTLFYSLYLAMFRGTWTNFNIHEITTAVKPAIAKLIEIVTSLFNNVDTPVTNIDALVDVYGGIPPFLALISFVLALITSIGIVVMAVKGIKRVFGVFFMGIR